MISLKFRELREAAGLTQTDVAKAVNVSKSAVCLWEKGTRIPSATLLPILADLYTCSIDALYGRGAAAEPSIAGEEGKRHAG